VAAAGRGLNGELPPKAPDVSALLEPLVRHGVDFVLVGGMAGAAHGSTYPSYDVDVAYARDRANLDRLVAALREIGVTLRGAPDDLPFQVDARTLENGANFTFVTPHGDLDVLADVGGIKSYEEIREASEPREIGGVAVRVASLDHLIAMKRAAGRTKDKLMVEEYVVLADEHRRTLDDRHVE
jgi:predicted nucleotidyltransferase